MIRFIEDDWLGGQRIGDGSFDGIANSIDSMFTFVLPSTCYRTVILNDQTGEVTRKGCAHSDFPNGRPSVKKAKAYAPVGICLCVLRLTSMRIVSSGI
jgi:hypothetical protein